MVGTIVGRILGILLGIIDGIDVGINDGSFPGVSLGDEDGDMHDSTPKVIANSVSLFISTFASNPSSTIAFCSKETLPIKPFGPSSKKTSVSERNSV